MSLLLGQAAPRNFDGADRLQQGWVYNDRTRTFS